MGERDSCGCCINGVCCTVASCQYHLHGNGCGATHIDVRDDNSAQKSHTFCGTYRPLDIRETL